MVRPFDVEALLEEVGDEPPDAEPRRPVAAAGTGPRAAHGPEEVRRLLVRMATSRARVGPELVDIDQERDGIWHLRVRLADPAERDAVYMRVAEGAMEASAHNRIPVIVHVEVVDGPGPPSRTVEDPRASAPEN